MPSGKAVFACPLRASSSHVAAEPLQAKAVKSIRFDDYTTHCPLNWLSRNQVTSRETSGEEFWRRGWESNPRIKVLQTSPLPLGYRAVRTASIANLPN